MDYCRCCRRSIALAVALVGLGPLLGGWAFGQTAPPPSKYKQDPVDEEVGKRLKQQVFTALGDARLTPATRQMFTDYYEKFALPRWTRVASAGEFKSYRDQLRNDFRRCKTGEVHQFLTDLFVKWAEPRLTDAGYAVMVRANILVAIGEMNSEDPMLGEPPPLPRAVPILLQFLNDEKQPEGMRVAALRGIRRHVTAKAILRAPPDQQSQAIQQSLLKLAATPVVADEKQVGLQWMRDLAVDTLGNMRDLGPNNQVVALLSSIVADEKSRWRTRLIAMASLSQLNLPPNAPGVDFSKLASTVGQFLASACEREVKDVKTYGTALTERRLKSAIGPALAALNGPPGGRPPQTGIKGAASDASLLSRITALEKIINSLIKDLESDPLAMPDQKLVESIENHGRQIRDWIDNQPAAAGVATRATN